MTALTTFLEDRISQSMTIGETQNIWTTQYGDGYQQTIRRGLNSSKQKRSIQFLLKNQTELDTEFFANFFDLVGYHTPFTWDAFNQKTVNTKWIIDKDSLSVTNPSGTAFDVSITVTEDFGL